MSTVISVENVSKQYRLGQIGTGTLSHDINRWWHRVRGKEDPYLKIGESNDRSKKGDSDYAWALRDISFEVKQGEVLGIIGSNGAGKSTLLKILSRVTSPTSGGIKVKGRIASLLEVGTGFHPELSGRENIFLNGAILGMRKHEIVAKFDEIVDFSGCERYIDTPVKRYSSGMYVRLAFAVAAHLDPEILIIDEVLAVGDAAFQKKCLGKMKDVASHGRTVIFVSHNMSSVSSLCSRALYLKRGHLETIGKTEEVISEYLTRQRELSHENFVGDSRGRLLDFWVEDVDSKARTEFAINEEIKICMKYEILCEEESFPYPNFHFFDQRGECAFISSNLNYPPEADNSPGTFLATCHIPPLLLNASPYFIGLALTFTRPDTHISFFLQDAICLKLVEPIEDEDLITRRCGYSGDIPGAVRPHLQWKIQSLENK